MQRAGRLADAAAIYLGILALEPGNFDALHMLGVVRLRQGDAQAAEDCIRRALVAKPGDPAATANLGTVLRAAGRAQEAVPAFDAALASGGALAAEILLLRGATREELGDFAGAEGDFERAVACDPSSARARMSLGMMHLARGAYATGWALFEARHELAGEVPSRLPPAIPVWDGREPLAGRTILLCAEEGLGDMIQFVRHVPALQARGAKVVLAVPVELEALFAASFPDAGVVTSLAHAAADCCLPIVSIAHRLAVDPDRENAAVPYLRAPAERLPRWRRELDAVPGRRIGVCWAGNPQHPNDRLRSLPVADVRLPVAPGERWISMQVGAEPGSLPAGVEALPLSVADFADTACAIACMDLVVCVDTSVAHLAGALGKPAWVLLPVAADWRWKRDATHSSWYPTARLFRQPRRGDWKSVLDEVRRALDA